MSGQAFLPARAQTGDQTGDRGLERQDPPPPPRFPRVQSGRALTAVGDPPPRGPQLGRRGCPGRNQSPEPARPPRGPAAGVTLSRGFLQGHPPRPPLSVSLDYTSACLGMLRGRPRRSAKVSPPDSFSLSVLFLLPPRTPRENGPISTWWGFLCLILPLGSLL